MTSCILSEDEIEATIREFLKRNDFIVKKRESIVGVDIFAEKENKVFLIECKGNKRKDERETKGSQYDVHLGESFFQIAKRMEEFKNNAEYIIAFPMSEKILKRIKDRNYFRKLNKINYLFVDENKKLRALKFDKHDVIEVIHDLVL